MWGEKLGRLGSTYGAVLQNAGEEGFLGELHSELEGLLRTLLEQLPHLTDGGNWGWEYEEPCPSNWGKQARTTPQVSTLLDQFTSSPVRL